MLRQFTNSCNKKVVELDNGLMRCPKCLRSWQEGIVKYRVVRVADHSGDAPMIIWDRECSSLIGMSAMELKAKYSGGGECVPVELKSLGGMALLFRVMVKEQLLSLRSPFIVIRICKDEEVLSQHCSSLLSDSPLWMRVLMMRTFLDLMMMTMLVWMELVKKMFKPLLQLL